MSSRLLQPYGLAIKRIRARRYTWHSGQCDISVGTVMAVIESMVGWISAWLALARSICAVRAAECSEEFPGISRDVLIWANAVWPSPSHDESGGV